MKSANCCAHRDLNWYPQLSENRINRLRWSWVAAKSCSSSSKNRSSMNLQTCMFVFIKIICDHKMGNTFSFVCCMVPGVQDNNKDDSSSWIEEAVLGHDLQRRSSDEKFWWQEEMWWTAHSSPSAPGQYGRSFQQNRPTVWLDENQVESFGGISCKYHVGPRKPSERQKVFVWSRWKLTVVNKLEMFTCSIWRCKKKEGSLAK